MVHPPVRGGATSHGRRCCYGLSEMLPYVGVGASMGVRRCYKDQAAATMAVVDMLLAVLQLHFLCYKCYVVMLL
jgi:hypothetical protein